MAAVARAIASSDDPASARREMRQKHSDNAIIRGNEIIENIECWLLDKVLRKPHILAI